MSRFGHYTKKKKKENKFKNKRLCSLEQNIALNLSKRILRYTDTIRIQTDNFNQSKVKLHTETHPRKSFQNQSFVIPGASPKQTICLSFRSCPYLVKLHTKGNPEKNASRLCRDQRSATLLMQTQQMRTNFQEGSLI